MEEKFTSRGKDLCLDLWAKDFTSKIDVKISAFEVKIRAYEEKSWAYEVKIRAYEVKLSAYVVKSLAQKSRHESLPREVKFWAHWAEGYDPKTAPKIQANLSLPS